MQADEIRDVVLHQVAVTPGTTWSFVALHLRDGTVGWGEATLVRSAALLDAVVHEARGALTGRRIPDIEAWMHAAAPGGLQHAAVRSAVEQAALDASGRQAACNASAFLGGYVRDGVPVYANINRRTRDRSPQGFADSAGHALAAGYSTLKIAPFDGVTPINAAEPEGRALIDAGLKRIAAVRQAAGMRAEIYVDCHWRFDAGTAAGVLDAVAALGVTWFECPVPETEEAMSSLCGLRTRANTLGVRLAGLEELPHPEAFGAWLQRGCYDVVMPDVKYAGGISGVLRVAELAARHATACAPHNPTGPICHAASLIASGVSSNVERLEHQYDETPAFFGLVGNSLPAVDGGISALPTSPGLGHASMNLP